MHLIFILSSAVTHEGNHRVPEWEKKIEREWWSLGGNIDRHNPGWKHCNTGIHYILSYDTTSSAVVLITHIYSISPVFDSLFVCSRQITPKLWLKLFPLITTGVIGNMIFLKGQFAYFSLRVFACHADLVVLLQISPVWWDFIGDTLIIRKDITSLL